MRHDDICCPVVEISTVKGPDNERDLKVSAGGRSLDLSIECMPANHAELLKPGNLAVLIPRDTTLPDRFKPFLCSYRYGGMSLLLPTHQSRPDNRHWIFDDGTENALILSHGRDAAALIEALRD